MRGLAASVREVLDRRLQSASRTPIAVALSGGGDSLALALIAADWARDHGRSLLILTVDHRLRAESRAWTQACAATARRLGSGFRALAWEGEKPATGLPAAARSVRHRLIADAAREAGAKVVLMGHTASDRLEAAAMREAGATTPSPREWSPSPVWPEGRAVFLLRPLLTQTRADIRAWLTERGETWIEDPANEDVRFARARARAGLTGAETDDVTPVQDLADLARAAIDLAGGLALPRAALLGAPRAFLAIACLCAAGTARPPRRDRLARLAPSLSGDFTATLAGARVEADGDQVRFLRDAGRQGPAPVTLGAGATGVWDGRFEITTERSVTIQALAGQAAGLPASQRATLQRLPAGARGTLPFVTGEGSPMLTAIPGVSAHPLALDRLRAACGVVDREPA
ncbi:tRNA lysidine(34) synthetase TilS [Phenylobacterium sp.]|uniref:tRNA lysidine(34) synthetase TilS n=1 Tax=Phenylobacterium sp. TaxID=1871053 RepID=UPI00272456AF|nr:tRNA lysidine(34) synthetase TilS [Phenylobacterium sp.]MDO8381312.1 tRNA lysidine(34) synthetase TilS [Phenylobacterium sp.]